VYYRKWKREKQGAGKDRLGTYSSNASLALSFSLPTFFFPPVRPKRFTFTGLPLFFATMFDRVGSGRLISAGIFLHKTQKTDLPPSQFKEMRLDSVSHFNINPTIL